MNYQRIYDLITSRAIGRVLDQYTEKHHVIPRCLGGGDEKSNIVRLTAREHFICHACLVRIHPSNGKIRFAFNMMSVKNGLQVRVRIKSRLFESNRIALKEHMSRIHKGKIISQENRDAVSRRFKGKPSVWLGVKGPANPNYGKKRPGFIGGRPKGTYKNGPRKVRRPQESHDRQAATLKKVFGPSFNKNGYEILTPSGFKPFHGVAYSGLVPVLKFKLENGLEISVSRKHVFGHGMLAGDCAVGEILDTNKGLSRVVEITPLVKKPTFDILEVKGNVYVGNGIHNHNCEHVTDANLQVIAEWDDRYIEDLPPNDYYRFYHRYVAMDLGIRDHTAAIFGYYDFRRAALVIEHEYVTGGSELTTQTLQKGLKAKELEAWPDGRKPYIRVADNNNPLLLQDLSFLHDLHFVPTDKGRLEEMVNTVKIRVRGGGLIVHPRCLQTIGCLKYGVWDKHKDKFGRSNVYGHFDALAALIYLVRNLDLTTNPIPHDFQTDQSNQIIFPAKNQSQAAASLQNAFQLNRKR